MRNIGTSRNNGCVQQRNQSFPHVYFTKGLFHRDIKIQVVNICHIKFFIEIETLKTLLRSGPKSSAWPIKFSHHFVPTYVSRHFTPAPLSQYVLFWSHSRPFANSFSMPGTFTTLCLCSSYSLPAMPLFSSPSSEFLSAFVKPSWLTYSDSLSLIPLLHYYIIFQLFVCMPAFVLRQGAPWKLVLIFWCLSRIGKNANSPWCCI